MAVKQAKDVAVYFGTYDFGTATTMVEVNLENPPLDVTVFGDAAEKGVAGLRKDTLTWAGLFNDGTSVDAAGSAMMGSSTNNVLSALLGTVAGNVAYSGQVILLKAQPDAGDMRALVRQVAELTPDGTWARCKLLINKWAASATGVSAGSLDDSALSTAGGELYFHVHSYSGTDNVTVQVRDSADGTAFAGVGTIVSGSTGTSGKATFTGTFRRYVDAQLSAFSSAGGTATVTVTYKRG